MKKVKMSKKNIVEYLIGKLVIFVLECAIGTSLIFGFFWCIGMLEQFIETHTWAFVIMAIVTIASIFKMVANSK